MKLSRIQRGLRQCEMAAKLGVDPRGCRRSSPGVDERLLVCCVASSRSSTTNPERVKAGGRHDRSECRDRDDPELLRRVGEHLLTQAREEFGLNRWVDLVNAAMDQAEVERLELVLPSLVGIEAVGA